MDEVTQALVRIEKYEAQMGDERGVYMPAGEHGNNTFAGDMFTLAKAYRAERDSTPLTREHLREHGWTDHGGVLFDKLGLPFTVWLHRDGRASFGVRDALLVESATLGDLRTLTRILSKEPPHA